MTATEARSSAARHVAKQVLFAREEPLKPTTHDIHVIRMCLQVVCVCATLRDERPREEKTLLPVIQESERRPVYKRQQPWWPGCGCGSCKWGAFNVDTTTLAVAGGCCCSICGSLFPQLEATTQLSGMSGRLWWWWEHLMAVLVGRKQIQII